MMEKHTKLIRQIKEAVRAKALEIPRFAERKEGCIRITFHPECQEAFEWVGRTGNYKDSDAPVVEDVYVILPGGNYVAEFVDDDGITLVDTYAMTAMKIAQLAFARAVCGRMLSGKSDYPLCKLSAENGFASWCGALCCEIHRDHRTPRGSVCCKNGLFPFCAIYVSVSGAAEDEDLACAVAAIKVIQDFFADNGKFVVRAPELN